MKKEENYRWASARIRKKVKNGQDQISVLANCAAILKESFPEFFWAGFYYFRGDHLSLGPFQGPPACERLELGSGVCADSANKGKTVLVENVHEYPGHVACDSRSNSEIVVPLYNAFGELKAVLDIDSETLNYFSAEDIRHLEKIAGMLKPVWDI